MLAERWNAEKEGERRQHEKWEVDYFQHQMGMHGLINPNTSKYEAV